VSLFPRTQYLTNETFVGIEFYENNENLNIFSSPIMNFTPFNTKRHQR